jgi:hypothetical protein|tara:strand:- start:227 stop:562 length:336 start_codon:yes stop_codon:yes gene_type:complete
MNLQECGENNFLRTSSPQYAVQERYETITFTGSDLEALITVYLLKNIQFFLLSVSLYFVFKPKSYLLIKEINMECGCGRSPTGKCIGWHKLSEEEYQEKLKEHEDKDNEEE